MTQGLNPGRTASSHEQAWLDPPGLAGLPLTRSGLALDSHAPPQRPVGARAEWRGALRERRLGGPRPAARRTGCCSAPRGGLRGRLRPHTERRDHLQHRGHAAAVAAHPAAAALPYGHGGTGQSAAPVCAAPELGSCSDGSSGARLGRSGRLETPRASEARLLGAPPLP